MKMEFNLPSIALLFSFFIFLFISIKTFKKPNKSTLKLPPGPPQLPLITNLHNLLLGSSTHRILRNLANKYGPLMYLQLGQLPTVVISSPEIAMDVMKTHDIVFAQRPLSLVSTILLYDSTDIIFSPNNNYWRQLRKICIMELLSPKRVQTFRSIREEEVSNLITDLKSSGYSSVNLSRKIFSLTYGITGRAALGEKSKDQDEFIKLVEVITKHVTGFSIVELYPSLKFLQVLSGARPRLENMHKKMDTLLERIVDQHKQGSTIRKTGEEDLVDVLLRIQRHGELEFPVTGDNIKAVIWDIFTAGSETSSTTVEWAMSQMLRNPRVMEMAQTEVRRVFAPRGNVDETGLNELKYLKAVIKETLRLHPSLPLISRESNNECEIDGYIVPANAKVIINSWTIGRDPRYWPEPETFNPERFLGSGIDFKGTNFEYIPFGAGRRICPGITLALANIELPLAQLLYHFDWKLDERLKAEELDMSESFGLSVRRKNDLYLIPVPYRPSPAE